MSSVKSLLVTAVAGLALGTVGAAQVIPGSDGPVPTNTGLVTSWTFEGHVLTVGSDGAADGGGGILYAPSEADDPGYRAAISAAAGGVPVDYFDARASTPSVALMSNYDCVYTWANFAYADNVGFGNNLAAYNDAGGTVVLGVFCTFTSGNFLSGTIMTSTYCPVVSPLGNNHFSSSSYIGDGESCIYTGVASLTSTFRDFLVEQGTGLTDGTYADGEICHAYRTVTGPSQGDVIYSNGSGAFQLGGSGDWAAAVANGCTCGVGAANAWTDEGSALAGGTGDPLLEATGTMVADTTQVLDLSNAAGSALSGIVGSFSSSPTPFKGGTLLPGPSIVVFLVTTSPAGGWSLNFRTPEVATTGYTIWVQVAIQDGAAVQGVSLSNACLGTTP